MDDNDSSKDSRDNINVKVLLTIDWSGKTAILMENKLTEQKSHVDQSFWFTGYPSRSESSSKNPSHWRIFLTKRTAVWEMFGL